MDIDSMELSDLLSAETFAELFDIENEFERVTCENHLLQRAEQLKSLTTFRRTLGAFRREYVDKPRAEQAQLINAISDVTLEMSDKGIAATTIENFKRVLDGDPNIAGTLKYNELTNMPERVTPDNTLASWTDADTSWLRHYIEHRYKIHSKDKLDDAMNQTFNENRYHPIRVLISGLRWDGRERIGTLFKRYLRAEDTEYIAECERLVFAGGIHRVFEPGCKFDDNIIFQGGQGCGKTTFCRWLAIRDEWYREITEIDGQKGIEAVRGAWFLEFSELLAMKRARETEAVKSFITRQVDTYRPPFKHYIESFPRQCIFLGTTNSMQFLNDVTGSRRFFPVMCHSDGRDLYANENEIRGEILQCWAEAYAKYLSGDIPPVERFDLMNEIREKQTEVTEDDYRVGIIADYLSAPERNRVCVIEIWREALHEVASPKRQESNAIASILDNMDGWERKKQARCGEYGRQRAWERTEVEYEF